MTLHNGVRAKGREMSRDISGESIWKSKANKILPARGTLIRNPKQVVMKKAIKFILTALLVIGAASCTPEPIPSGSEADNPFSTSSQRSNPNPRLPKSE